MKETGQIMPEDKENFMNQESQTPHKRRVRYKGKYPRKFEEKYKELNPEKYKDTIEHVISKGNTPAGMHISIMVNEILDFLKIQPGETGFDATLGYGGHTKAMMECLHGEGHMYATDVDPEESVKTRKRLAEQGFGEDILTVKLQNFCTIDEIAKEADFFCFGTNDLTQMTYGFSRDDAGKFLNAYYDAKIFENDPFAKLDQVGVGKLMEMAINLGRPVNNHLHIGICGEHGGDPTSVEFCHRIGLDYVSCSPFRVPIARLAAAQAALR